VGDSVEKYLRDLSGAEGFFEVDEDDDMSEVVRFEDKVKKALQEVMKHAVAGHSPKKDYNDAGFGEMLTSYTTFCNDPEHALEILRNASIVPANANTLANLLDKQG
jgi:hypothetical protein